MNYDYKELPLDPEEAFLILEARYRSECETSVQNSNQNDNVGIYYTDYIAQVLGAAEELGLVEALSRRKFRRLKMLIFTHTRISVSELSTIGHA